MLSKQQLKRLKEVRIKQSDNNSAQYKIKFNEITLQNNKTEKTLIDTKIDIINEQIKNLSTEIKREYNARFVTEKSIIDIWKKINNTENQVDKINNKLNSISSQQNTYENVQ